MQKNNSVPTGALTGAMSRSDYHKFANPNSVPKVYAREETRERTPMLKGWNTKRIKVVPKKDTVTFDGEIRKTHYVTSDTAKIKAVLL